MSSGNAKIKKLQNVGSNRSRHSNKVVIDSYAMKWISITEAAAKDGQMFTFFIKIEAIFL